MLAVATQANQGTFLFNNNLNAQEGAVATMTSVDPQNLNSYGTAFLYGATRTTYNTVGATGAGNNAGLHLDASSLIPSNQYTLEMVVSEATAGGYHKLADVSGLTSDTGYYIYPNSTLGVYNDANGTTATNPGTYYYFALTVNSTGEVKGYVNGGLEFTTTTAVMNGNIFDLFLDDSATSFNEYSDVSVGLVRLTDSVLSDNQISALSNNPYGTVPEPTSIAAVGIGVLALLRRRKKA
jgi:hypothetical protein